MKSPPWLSAAGYISARDNAQTILGSQRKSSVLFALQLIQSSRLFYKAVCVCSAAEDVDRELIEQTRPKS